MVVDFAEMVDCRKYVRFHWADKRLEELNHCILLVSFHAGSSQNCRPATAIGDCHQTFHLRNLLDLDLVEAAIQYKNSAPASVLYA